MSDADPLDDPDEPLHVPMPPDLGELSDEELARLAAEIWERFVAGERDEPPAET